CGDTTEGGGKVTAKSSVIAANPCIIQFTVKTPKVKKEFVVPENITIKLFKGVVSKHFDCQTSQLVLVFFGRILKDQDTLRQLGIHDGVTVYLVIRKPRRSQEELFPAGSPPASACSSPVPPRASSTSNSTFVLAERSPSNSNMSAQSTEQETQLRCMPTSVVMAQALESLVAQSMLSNPDLMRQLIMANPQMQQLAQQIPEISHILNNTNVMKEMLDIVRNSDMLREIRSQDRAVSNLENVPGRDNTLMCVGTESQDTLLNATHEQFGNNSFASLVRNRSLERTGRRSHPSCNDTRDHSGSPSPSQSATSVCTGSISADLDHSVTSSTTHLLGQSSLSPSFGSGVGAETPNRGGVQSMLHQVTESLQLIVNLCAFYTKWMTLLLLQRSQLAAPPVPSTEVTQQHQDVMQRVPDFFQQIQSPEMLAAMSNPKAMQACLQIEQGLQILAVEAPVLIPWFAFRLRSLGNAGNSANAASNSSGSAGPGTNPEPWQAPEIKFQEEPEQFKLIGFSNSEGSVRVVTATRETDRQQQKGGSIQSAHRSNVS
uniref:Ubiquitin-like domain-containing protein n=1 Tax=Dromaius novaehollandiae TaxID=8790 RepID=A0A8C4IYH7_DRONO